MKTNRSAGTPDSAGTRCCAALEFVHLQCGDVSPLWRLDISERHRPRSDETGIAVVAHSRDSLSIEGFGQRNVRTGEYDLPMSLKGPNNLAQSNALGKPTTQQLKP